MGENLGGMGRIFEGLLGSPSVFTRKDFLRPTFVPESLPHREEQKRCLAEVVVDSARDCAPSNVLAYGKPGTGKTAVTLHVLNEFESFSASRPGPAFTTLYLNCQQISTPYRVYYRLAQCLGVDVPFTGLPADSVFQEFLRALEASGKTAVITLDEVDRLADRDAEVLYNLSRVNTHLRRSRVCLVGISNDVNFVEHLDARVRSSLGEEIVVFPPYNYHQLSDILQERVRMSFQTDVVEEAAVSLCAAISARESGDARRALNLLRISGEIADRQRENRVTEDHVRQAQARLERDRVGEVVTTLNSHAKILLHSLATSTTPGPVTTGAAYALYERFCRRIGVTSVTPRMVTSILAELDSLGVLRAPVVCRSTGRTREVTLAIASGEIRRLLSDDELFRDAYITAPYLQTRLPSI